MPLRSLAMALPGDLSGKGSTSGGLPRLNSRVARELPTGTVTFVFTDVEGSTRLLQQLGAEAYADALAQHRRALREAFMRYDGVEVDTQGDSFFVAFSTAPAAIAAATEARQVLSAGAIRVRMGIHTGTAHVTDEGYVGADVHRAARIAAAGPRHRSRRDPRRHRHRNRDRHPLGPLLPPPIPRTRPTQRALCPPIGRHRARRHPPAQQQAGVTHQVRCRPAFRRGIVFIRWRANAWTPPSCR